MNDSKWLKVTPSLNKGIEIINQLEEAKCEQFLRKIAAKLKTHDSEFFTEDERLKLEKIFKVNGANLTLAIKTIVYLFRRILKYVFKPLYLKDCLTSLGLSTVKADFFVTVWSIDTRTIFDELGADFFSNNDNELNVSWKVNAELSSDIRKKEKVPKAYLSMSTAGCEQELELTHSELYSIFLTFEALQAELDTIM